MLKIQPQLPGYRKLKNRIRYIYHILPQWFLKVQNPKLPETESLWHSGQILLHIICSPTSRSGIWRCSWKPEETFQEIWEERVRYNGIWDADISWPVEVNQFFIISKFSLWGIPDIRSPRLSKRVFPSVCCRFLHDHTSIRKGLRM